MKKLKIKLPLLSFVLILSVVMFSCKKKKTAPSVSLNGASSITLCVGAEYVEAGASATDAYGDDIDVVITSNVNTAQIGTYTVEYTATDKNDNVTTEVSSVVVELCASSILGDYSVNPTCDIDLGVTTVGLVNDTQTISSGGTDTQLIIDNVNTFIPQMNATFSGNTITIPEETFSIVGVAEGSISGAGTINETGTIIQVTYTYSFVDNFLGFTLASGTCDVTYTKQ